MDKLSYIADVDGGQITIVQTESNWKVIYSVAWVNQKSQTFPTLKKAKHQACQEYRNQRIMMKVSHTKHIKWRRYEHHNN